MNDKPNRLWISKNNGSDLPILVNKTEAIKIFYENSTSLFMPKGRNTNL